MRRRQFFQRLLAGFAAIPFAGRLFEPKPGAIRDVVYNAGVIQPVQRRWIADPNCPPDRIYAFYGSRSPVYGSIGPWHRPGQPSEPE